ncbi:MAG: class I SAM-dependent methyltransferase [Methanomassiliicoccales archaeon]
MSRAVTSEHQLRRQLSWLGQPWVWLMRTRVIERPGMTALDIGCGPGLVMELFSPYLDVTGVDIDPDMVRRTTERKMEAVVGDAMRLPFEEESFDIVYCAFTMLWVKEPEQAIKEMVRVARSCVVCLAEPDYGSRVCYPKEIADLDGPLIDSLREEGSDPMIGRKIGPLMEDAGLLVESGVHSGAWSPTQMRSEAEGEWGSLYKAVKDRVDDGTLASARTAWEGALNDGTLCLYNPVFYAVGWKR